ncbi:MAG: hypothetical protein WD115_06290 [Balneolaceae bacterium]
MWFNRGDKKNDETESTDEGSIKEMLEDARIYLEKRIELLMLGFVERFTFLLADAVQRLAGLVIFTLGAFFFWFAFSFIVSDWVGSTAIGFLLTSLPLLLAGGMFLWIQPGRVRRAIQAGMIRQFLRAFDDSTAGRRSASSRETYTKSTDRASESPSGSSKSGSGTGSGSDRDRATPRPTLSNEETEKG